MEQRNILSYELGSGESSSFEVENPYKNIHKIVKK